MAKRGPRYSKEEFARRGDEVYETKVKPHLKKRDKGRFVAVDIESGEWEISDDEMEVIKLLYSRLADPQPWMVRVGSPYLRSYGGRGLSSGQSP